MSDEDAFTRHQRALLYKAPKAPPRQPQPGELLCEFHVERAHTFDRVGDNNRISRGCPDRY